MTEVNLDLTGKVALVTGGSRGLGKAIAVALAGNGANVAICGRKQENLDNVYSEFREMGFDVMTKVANVGSSEQVTSLFESVEKRFGKLDILVNNVGINMFTPSTSEADENLWDKIIDINLKSAYLASGQAVRLMKKAGGGKIINISSTAARKAAKGMGIYCISKAALEMLTRVLALELAKDNINVNAVAPYVVRTEFSKPFWSNEAMLKEITKTVPLGRIAEPNDVVGSVVFLASDLSDLITGEIIVVDGGNMA